MTIQLRLGNEALLAYKRLPYKTWYAIAEFVDNSTDAYFRVGNRDLLDAAFLADSDRLEVEVTWDRSERLLRIEDNSMGMDLGDLEAAMVIGGRPKVTAGRSEFGMGMKTASVWFADEIEIRTKKLGTDREFRTTIDVQAFVQGVNDMQVTEVPKDTSLHYTVIELKQVNRGLGESALNKARSFLGSIYRTDLRDGKLHLTVNGQTVLAPPSKDDDAFLTRSDGSKLVVPVDFVVGEKPVAGWIGVLKPGYTGRNNAGVSLIRHGRTLRGWLDSWRPEEIFGDARNDTLNQRVVGELHLDAFSSSHTKDAIDWDGDEEEILGKALRKKADEFGLLKEAKRKTGRTGESAIESAEAQAQVQEEFNSPRVQDEFKIIDVPKPEVADLSQGVLLEAADVSDAVVRWGLPGARSAYLFELELSVNDPYYTYEVMASGDLRIVINANHPAYGVLDTAEAKLAHYHHVILDAVSEWFCDQQQEPVHSATIRQIKDRLFRTLTDVAERL